MYIYLKTHANVFTFISPPYNIFRPQTAIIRYFVYAKTDTLYEMYKIFIYIRVYNYCAF
jgi:hypothetical protein